MSVLQEKNRFVPVVLSVAGLDPSGGAGLYADIKTFSMLDVWGMGVISTLTTQDAGSFYGMKAVDKDFFESQLEKMFSSRKISGVKIGLITEVYQAELIYFFLKKYAPGIVVLDPVAFSSTGKGFWSEAVKENIKRLLLPSCDVVTPNLKEAELLLGVKDMAKKDIALAISKEYRCKVAVTGGDSLGASVVDVFCDGLRTEERKAEYIDIDPRLKHGTGCTFSSALCAYMARGMDFIEACSLSSLFVENAIRAHYVFDEEGGLNHHFRSTL